MSVKHFPRRNTLLLVNLLILAVIFCFVQNFKFSGGMRFRPSWREQNEYNSNDLVAHQAYLDRRPGPSHSNVTVVSVSVFKDYRQDIIGCDIDGIQSHRTEVVDIMILFFIETYFPVSHKDCFVYCFDIDINRDSEVSVLYKKNGTIIKEPVRSDSVVIPPENVPEKDEVMVCAAGFGVVPYLDQWLTYQKTIGVKLIHINIDPSFLQNLNKSSTLFEFVRSGFVKMVVWKDYLNSSQVYYYSQSLKYHDCALRYMGIFKYMMVIDFDEFFVPLDTNKTVLFYAKKLIVNNVGTVVLARQDYCKLKKLTLPSDGNMTKVYDTSIFSHTNEGKSLHLVKSLDQVSIHRAGVLSNYTLLNYRDSPMSASCYLAHLTRKQPRFRCRR